ncbi:copper resistance CopC/CopD family protein [Paenibacillus hamazuiensis]|uniref:copper resistance CopC/CopD family protein n=1 Tax=Paenibacillus hamazuiensis TaxID=2936508 RepID=UPI00200EACDE|nr:copper resistance protein CopC [Paenibacillus hamazuiensis]
MKIRRLLWIFVLLALAMPVKVFAHATLIQTEPGMNAQVASSPAQVTLTFNERLEEGSYYIKVYDSGKKQVTAAKAAMNAEHTGLALDLPKLPDGDYIVTYHVISADGHPVEGTYMFTVGQGGPKTALPADAMQGMHQHNGLAYSFGWQELLQFIARILYYASLLGATGWVIWRRMLKPLHPETESRLNGVGTWLQRALLLAVILMMYTHLQDMVSGGGAEALIELFTRTGTGYAWLAVLGLSLLGFVLLHRNAVLDMLWAAGLFAAEAYNGHAAAFGPLRETLLLDGIHLASAAVWMGGLILLLALYRINREEALIFLPRFSKAALYSVFILIVSGVLTTLLFLPNVRYVIYTKWGWLLLAKTALVFFVVVTAGWVRRAYRLRKPSLPGWLVLDAIWMVLIVGIVGVFTYLSPLPPNEPLHYHVMGEKQHMTVQISPNAPGPNTFIVRVWLPEKMGKPKQVLLKLKDEESADIAPIEVPIAPFDDPQPGSENYGMKPYSYRAEGNYLPYAGLWKVEVRVMDSNDDEMVYEKEMRIY